MLAKLDADKRRLKQVQSVQKKIEVKRELLPDYAAWIEGVLQADAGGQDDVLMHVIVWRIDVEDYAGALEIADYALRHGLKLPAHYNRTLGCLLAEEFAEQAHRARNEKRAVDLSALRAIDQLTAGEDMPDEVRAKLAKEIGLACFDKGEARAALASLERALALFNGVGVKKDIERIERALKNQPVSDVTLAG